MILPQSRAPISHMIEDVFRKIEFLKDTFILFFLHYIIKSDLNDSIETMIVKRYCVQRNVLFFSLSKTVGHKLQFTLVHCLWFIVLLGIVGTEEEMSATILASLSLRD